MPNELVAVIVKLKVPAVVGVPVIAPVDVLSVRPAGSAPTIKLNVIGAVPVAEMDCEYGMPTVPAGSGLAVVIVGCVPGTAAPPPMNLPSATGAEPTAAVVITVLVAASSTETLLLVILTT